MMNDKTPLVSVIIPTYNRADWLKIAIESVLMQVYQTFELLILDNGSNDHTAKIVAGFSDHRIKYFRHPCNIGIWANWSYGVYWSQGEYLSILCDDDFYKADFINSRMNIFAKYKNIQAVFSNYEYCDEYGKITSISKTCSDNERIMQGKALLLCVVRNWWFIGATLFKRDIVVKHWNDIQRAGKACDTSLKIRIALDPQNLICWINNQSLVNRQHANQDSIVGGRQVLLGHIAAYNEPLIFENYRWPYRRLLYRGAARGYGALKRCEKKRGDLRLARRFFLCQLLAFPYLPWIYAIMTYVYGMRRRYR